MAYRANQIAHDVTTRRCEEICDAIVRNISSSPDTPQLTGELRSSYHVGYDADLESYLVYSTAPYWAYVEYGTRRVNPYYSDAQPHVAPAIEAALAQYRGRR